MRVVSAAVAVSIMLFTQALAAPAQLSRRGEDEDVSRVPSLLLLAGSKLWPGPEKYKVPPEKYKQFSEYLKKPEFEYMSSALAWEAYVNELLSENMTPFQVWKIMQRYRISPDMSYELFEPQPDTPGGPWYELSVYWQQVLRKACDDKRGILFLFRIRLWMIGSLNMLDLPGVPEPLPEQVLSEAQAGPIRTMYEAWTHEGAQQPGPDDWASLPLTKPQINYLIQGIARLSRGDYTPSLDIRAAISQKLRRLPGPEQEAFKKWLHPESPNISNEAGEGGGGGQLENAG